jgi:EF hand domain-containing protein
MSKADRGPLAAAIERREPLKREETTMIINLRTLVQSLPGACRQGAVVLGLALLAAGCASDSSKQSTTNMTPNASGMTPQELFNQYDNNNDNQIDQNEWDGAFRSMDTNGDGVVSQSEFHAATGGGGRR